ncbi:beta-glucosidase [Modestobacter italicus]|uniref:beta-glucosidase n=1 Tax=Modestobacter italicus (strain DSM 44449 / CECT 9708 / BC 501) TaxID=2732864 RepID=UPI001C95FC3F|nr:glycoside hydrolase family 3 C-terminal domain-containing protein [Modestobacter italicus]
MALPIALTGLVTPLLVVAAPTSAAATPTNAATDCSDTTAYPWMDTTATADERAQALLDASTPHQVYRWLVEQPANAPQQTTFGGVTYPAQVPCTPTVVYTDGPDGVRFTPGVTAFPAPIAVASTWDEELTEARSAAIAAEAFDKGKNVVLGPGLASGRTPLSGRTAEYFGEDPLLTGLLTAATVNGLEESGDPDQAVLSNLKHYVANEQELDRQTSSSNVDERTRRQIYDLPFEIALDRSSPASVMCSYNQVNGVYGCENPLLDDVLRDDLGFDGYVVSDFGAVHSTAPSLVNGLDQELNRPIWFTPERLDQALAAGDVTQAQIDQAAFRVVRTYIDGGLFDHPLPATPVADASTPEHEALARRVAAEGSVLLQNDGVLPLAPAAGDTIALIGPTASSTPTDGVSAASVCSMAWRFNNAGTMECEDLVSPETAIRERAAQDGATVTFTDGSDVAAAAAAAAQADVAVVFGYQRSGEFSDLPDLRLQGNGDALIEAVAAANPDTVVVLQTGSAVEMPWVDDVRAVLETWYAGEQMGPATADLLFGDVNPSGKLPMTFPVSLADTPTAASPDRYPGTFADGSTTRAEGSTEIRQVEYGEGLQVGHRWYEAQEIDPLFAFGHGLSYTEFEYSRVKVTPVSNKEGREVRIRFRLTNTGDRAGTETAQAYLSLPDEAGEPFRRLVGWEQVTLQPGEHRTVEIVLTEEDLAELHLLQVWDEDAGSWATPRGRYEVTVGGSIEATERSRFRIR